MFNMARSIFKIMGIVINQARRTIGHLAPVDMDSSQQVSILGKKSDASLEHQASLVESGGSHGGRGGAKIPYEALMVMEFTVPAVNGSSGAASGGKPEVQ